MTKLNDRDTIDVTRYVEGGGGQKGSVPLFRLREWAGWGFYSDTEYSGEENAFVAEKEVWQDLPNNGQFLSLTTNH